MWPGTDKCCRTQPDRNIRKIWAKRKRFTECRIRDCRDHGHDVDRRNINEIRGTHKGEQQRVLKTNGGMVRRLKENFKEHNEEFKITKIEDLKIKKRLENNILGPEGRLMEDVSPVDQICCSEQVLDNRILLLEQE